jgi:AcrR family transcriptional regulator
MFPESVERNDLERALMRRRKDYIGGRAIRCGAQPVCCGHTPPIAGHQPREPILRHRRDQVISDSPLVLEKLGRDDRTDRVASEVLRTGVAAPVTKEAGHRVGATGRELSAQDVDVGHRTSIAAAAAGEPNQAGAPFDNPVFAVSVTNMESGVEQRRRYRMVARAEATAALRQRILDSTERLFEQSASDRFSLEDVAAGASTTVQTVLRHFGSKDQLLRAAIARAMDRVRDERMQAPVGDVPGAVGNLVEHYEDRGDMVLRWLAEEDRNAFMHEVLDHGRAFHREWVAQTFAPLLEQAKGTAKRRRLAQLVAITDVYVWKLFRRDMQLSRQQAQAAIIELIEALEAP